jgi:uncharacterized protein (TIGR02231 family)
MRPFLTFLLLTSALPALANTLAATSKITAVTVFPDGAKITREVAFTAPSAGDHEVLVTDLPAGTEPGLLRLMPAAGLQFGAFSLRADRLPPREDPLTPDQTAAKAEVTRLEAAEQIAFLALDAVQARVDAAEAQVRFLGSFTGALPDAATPDSIKAMAAMIGAETLAARQSALTARADLWPVQIALTDAQAVLAKARAAYDSLPGPDADYTTLSVAVRADAAGAATLTVTHYISGAGWRPYYDLMLTREGGDNLTIARSVLVTQYTGEDWSGVALTLSSSRPAEQAAPSSLWPDLRRIGPEQPEPIADATFKGGLDARAPEAVMAEAAPITTAEMGLEGDTVVYTYPTPVTIASGVEDLRLALDEVKVEPVVAAWAVPRFDATAFVMASFVNATGEPLLPGEALLFREGVLVGSTSLGMIAPGVETDIAFGALDSLQIKRDMPTRAEGETGVITTSNQIEEVAVLEVENLGDEVWPVHLIDQTPYSEQEDLEIEVTADPAPSETDVDGQKGVLAWDFDLSPGEKKAVRLEHVMTWPEGMVLQ